jgi:hypothetical protein
MTPARLAGDAAAHERAELISLRTAAYNTWTTTNHWPHTFFATSDCDLPVRDLRKAPPAVQALVLGVSPEQITDAAHATPAEDASTAVAAAASGTRSTRKTRKPAAAAAASAYSDDMDE